MSVPQLAIVRVDETVEAPAQRAQRLYAEAQGAAFEQVQSLEKSLAVVVALATEIAQGGEVYPAGARDLARRMGEDLAQRGQTLEAITQRARSAG